MRNGKSNDHSGGRMAWMVWIGLAVGLSGCFDKQQPAPPPEPDGSQPRDYRQMLDRVHQRNAFNDSLDTVKQAVQTFQVDLGRLPTNLIELVRYRYLDKFPEEVPPGFTYGYDSTRGYVTFMKIPDGEAETPAKP